MKSPLVPLALSLCLLSSHSHSQTTPPTNNIHPLTYEGKQVNPKRFILKLKTSPSPTTQNTLSQQALQAISRQGGGELQEFTKLRRISALETRTHWNQSDYLATLRNLRASGAFELVEPDYLVKSSHIPTDSAYTDGTLWGLKNNGQNQGTPNMDLNVEPAWALSKGSGTIVAVIDTGVRYTHQDLAPNMWRNPKETPNNGIDDDKNGYIDDVFGINAINNSGDPMDDHGHGSHVAGTIAAIEGGGPLVGVAPQTKIMALKFLDSGGSGWLSDAIKCLNYAAAHGAHLTNNSWGGGGFSQTMYDALIASQNLPFVAAAGNSWNNNNLNPFYPASYDLPNVIGVAALTNKGQLSWFSNFGNNDPSRPLVEISAPGSSIYSSTATSDSSYSTWDGTSMAAPHVSGVLALIKSHHPSANLTELKNRLFLNATIAPATEGKTTYGVIPNAYSALANPLPSPTPTPTPTPPPTPTPTPTPTPPPTITSPNTSTGTMSSPYTYQITATAPPNSWGVSSLPSGLRFSTASGLISGTPTGYGNHTLRLFAFYTGHTATANLSLSIAAIAPTITSPPTHTIRLGQHTIYQIRANNLPSSYGAANLPPGLSINTSTGTITGTPTQYQPTYYSTITASNPAGTALQTLTFQSPPPPQFTSNTTASGKVGVPLNFQIQASGERIVYSGWPIPPGLFISSDGLLQGTPTKEGTYSINLSASNTNGTSKQTLLLAIAPSPPLITPTNHVGILYQPFTGWVSIRNNPSLITSQNLPPGLSLHPQTGRISGAPTQLGNFTTTITASNTAGSDTKTIQIRVQGASPQFTSPAQRSALAQRPFYHQLTATNFPTAFQAWGLPQGLLLNTHTGVISGSPRHVGHFTIGVSARNNNGTGYQTLTLTVSSPFKPPQWNSRPPISTRFSSDEP